MGVAPASTRLIVSSGSSCTDATRWLANSRVQLGLVQLARVLERDAVEHVAEELLDQHPLGGRQGDAARVQVEEVLGIDRSNCRAMRAAYFVVVDLQHRDRGCLRFV